MSSFDRFYAMFFLIFLLFCRCCEFHQAPRRKAPRLEVSEDTKGRRGEKQLNLNGLKTKKGTFMALKTLLDQLNEVINELPEEVLAFLSFLN